MICKVPETWLRCRYGNKYLTESLTGSCSRFSNLPFRAITVAVVKFSSSIACPHIIQDEAMLISMSIVWFIYSPMWNQNWGRCDIIHPVKLIVYPFPTNQWPANIHLMIASIAKYPNHFFFRFEGSKRRSTQTFAFNLNLAPIGCWTCHKFAAGSGTWSRSPSILAALDQITCWGEKQAVQDHTSPASIKSVYTVDHFVFEMLFVNSAAQFNGINPT